MKGLLSNNKKNKQFFSQYPDPRINDYDPTFKSFNTNKPLDKNKSSSNFGYSKVHKNRDSQIGKNYKKRKGLANSHLHLKKNYNNLRSQPNSYMTNPRNQQEKKITKIGKLIFNKTRKSSTGPRKGRSSSVTQENIEKHKHKKKNQLKKKSKTGEGSNLIKLSKGSHLKKPQFSERESKSNSNAEDLLRQFNKKSHSRDMNLFKMKKMTETSNLGMKECLSPNELVKKTKKNCLILNLIN
jgi:hypothetical protein